MSHDRYARAVAVCAEQERQLQLKRTELSKDRKSTIQHFERERHALQKELRDIRAKTPYLKETIMAGREGAKTGEIECDSPRTERPVERARSGRPMSVPATTMCMQLGHGPRPNSRGRVRNGLADTRNETITQGTLRRLRQAENVSKSIESVIRHKYEHRYTMDNLIKEHAEVTKMLNTTSTG